MSRMAGTLPASTSDISLARRSFSRSSLARACCARAWALPWLVKMLLSFASRAASGLAGWASCCCLRSSGDLSRADSLVSIIFFVSPLISFFSFSSCSAIFSRRIANAATCFRFSASSMSSESPSSSLSSLRILRCSTRR